MDKLQGLVKELKERQETLEGNLNFLVQQHGSAVRRQQELSNQIVGLQGRVDELTVVIKLTTEKEGSETPCSTPEKPS